MKSEVSVNGSTAYLSESDIKILVQAGIIPDKTPPAQVAVFGQICKERGLSAFSKEIHLVGYKDKYSVIVGINGFRKIASESGSHAGTDDAKFDLASNGSYKTAAEISASAQKLPRSATVTVYRIVQGVRVPFTHTALYTEFASPSNQKWQSMPFQMLAKVAEAFALRKAFSDRLTGLSIDEEAAAIEGSTVDAVNRNPELAIDPEDLSRQISACTNVPALTALYNSNAGHREFAALFTERKAEILGNE